jgi:hypothetical protein
MQDLPSLVARNLAAGIDAAEQAGRPFVPTEQEADHMNNRADWRLPLISPTIRHGDIRICHEKSPEHLGDFTKRARPFSAGTEYWLEINGEDCQVIAHEV